MIISIVTPTLDACCFFRECIESVRRNESLHLSVEHIVVDGGSTDGTVELAESYGLKVIRGTDRGIFDAINKGSFAASGDLIGFLGADDLLLDGALPLLARYYREGGRRWVCGGVRWIDSLGVDLGCPSAPPTWLTPEIHSSLGWNCIWHMATYVSREFFAELGGFDISFRDAGDYDFFARALSRCPYTRVPAPLAVFRRTGENNSVVHGTRAYQEGVRVMEAFGPKSDAQRWAYRWLLKVWLNASGPVWCFKKHSVKGGLLV
jgi:glycosyltransferase involved in cell wall biosynthesis